MILTVGQRLSKHTQIGELLRSSEYTLQTVLSPAQLEKLLEANENYAIALIDLKDPIFSGYEAMRILREKSPETQVMVISHKHSTKEAVEAQSRGAFCYFSDPIDVEEFLFLVAKARVVFELAVNNRDLKAAISGTSEINFIGQGVEAQKLLKQVQRITQVDSTLLITGESGTGKTTLARLIHSKSNRRTQPFISLSCAAIPRDLLEAELFGYERGAFTGAISRKIGSLELANKGTLFLDEIGDLPLELQPKLLTFLQDRQICRIGATKFTPLDVRIISATNRDLGKMVQAKTFREDLYFRMNVVNIKLPSLQARRDDIGMLAENFLVRLAKTRGEKRCILSKDAYTQMLNYTWPGNIRELENVLERASLFCANYKISADDLEMTANLPFDDITARQSEEKLTLADIEKTTIDKRVKFFNGNKQEAAQSLGISLKTIYNKMRTYGLS